MPELEKWWLPLVSVVVPEVRKVVVISSVARDVGFGEILNASVGRVGIASISLYSKETEMWRWSHSQ